MSARSVCKPPNGSLSLWGRAGVGAANTPLRDKTNPIYIHLSARSVCKPPINPVGWVLTHRSPQGLFVKHCRRRHFCAAAMRWVKTHPTDRSVCKPPINPVGWVLTHRSPQGLSLSIAAADAFARRRCGGSRPTLRISSQKNAGKSRRFCVKRTYWLISPRVPWKPTISPSAAFTT